MKKKEEMMSNISDLDNLFTQWFESGYTKFDCANVAEGLGLQDKYEPVKDEYGNERLDPQGRPVVTVDTTSTQATRLLSSYQASQRSGGVSNIIHRTGQGRASIWVLGHNPSDVQGTYDQYGYDQTVRGDNIKDTMNRIARKNRKAKNRANNGTVQVDKALGELNQPIK